MWLGRKLTRWKSLRVSVRADVPTTNLGALTHRMEVPRVAGVGRPARFQDALRRSSCASRACVRAVLTRLAWAARLLAHRSNGGRRSISHYVIAAADEQRVWSRYSQGASRSVYTAAEWTSSHTYRVVEQNGKKKIGQRSCTLCATRVSSPLASPTLYLFDNTMPDRSEEVGCQPQFHLIYATLVEPILRASYAPRTRSFHLTESSHPTCLPVVPAIWDRMLEQAFST